MKLPLKPGRKAKVSAIKSRVYLLRNKTRQLVNKTFDKMHYLAYFKFTSEYTLFNFSVFIVWKLDAKGKKKGRVVVDIQKLNKMVFPNIYSLSFQSEIIANVQECTNFAILDTAFFLLMALSSRPRLYVYCRHSSRLADFPGFDHKIHQLDGLCPI